MALPAAHAMAALRPSTHSAYDSRPRGASCRRSPSVVSTWIRPTPSQTVTLRDVSVMYREGRVAREPGLRIRHRRLLIVWARKDGT